MHGNITREEADRRLAYYGTVPGVFLVREKSPGHSYVLSVANETGHVNHYIVSRGNEPDSFFVISSHGFPGYDSVEDVVRAIHAMNERYSDLPVLTQACRASVF
jgi:hypothetical protein